MPLKHSANLGSHPEPCHYQPHLHSPHSAILVNNNTPWYSGGSLQFLKRFPSVPSFNPDVLEGVISSPHCTDEELEARGHRGWWSRQ